MLIFAYTGKMKKLTGLSACGGSAAGLIVCVPEKPAHHIPVYTILPQDIPAEHNRLKTALQAAQSHLAALLANYSDKSINTPEKAILETQQMMLHDTDFLHGVYREIEETCVNVEAALQKKLNEITHLLTLSGDTYLAGRAIDIQDAFGAVFTYLLPKKEYAASRFAHLPHGALLAAQVIKPSEALAIKEVHPAGILMEAGGVTSHIAIIARAWNIPMLVGVSGLMSAVKTGMPAVLDSTKQELILEPDGEHYSLMAAAAQAECNDLPDSGTDYGTVYTKDGVAVYLSANIAFPEDTMHPIVQRTAGIGLFRSEFLFLGKDSLPDEDEQYHAYRNVLEAMENKPVVIRTFDAGADKMLEEQASLGEKNALLGWRAIRYCLDRPQLFKDQLRALLRASCYGNLSLLLPMISCTEEITAVQKLLTEVQLECDREGIAYKHHIPIGCMVEVPAIAAAADIYAPFFDFFSIGTNDLVQYTMAADRENTTVAHLADYFQPSVIRLIEHTAQAEHLLRGNGQGTVSVCGEMAAQEEAIPLLLGMGLRHFSMSVHRIPAIKHAVESITIAEAEQFTAQARTLCSADAVRKLIQEFSFYDT